jgi:hypothetical protein
MATTQSAVVAGGSEHQQKAAALTQTGKMGVGDFVLTGRFLVLSIVVFVPLLLNELALLVSC